MSNYNGCNRVIPHYLTEIIYTNMKSSHLEKLRPLQNINGLMLQVIFIFTDWILVNQIIDKILRSLKNMKGRILLILKNKDCKQHYLPFCWFYFSKRENIRKMVRWNGRLRHLSTRCIGFQENSNYTLHLCFS